VSIDFTVTFAEIMSIIEKAMNLRPEELSLILLLGLLLCSVCWYWQLNSKRKPELAWLNQFPCPSPAVPILGNVYEFAGNPTSNKAKIVLAQS
jgi:hypothetical protein